MKTLLSAKQRRAHPAAQVQALVRIARRAQARAEWMATLLGEPDGDRRDPHFGYYRRLRDRQPDDLYWVRDEKDARDKRDAARERARQATEEILDLVARSPELTVERRRAVRAGYGPELAARAATPEYPEDLPERVHHAPARQAVYAAIHRRGTVPQDQGGSTVSTKTTTTTKDEVVHVTGTSPEEINASFNAAVSHYTPKGEKRPTAAVLARLRRESRAAFAAIGIEPGPTALHVEQAQDRKAEAEHRAEGDAAEVTPRRGRTPQPRFPYCPRCGFTFKTPAPHCQSQAACDKRRAALTEPVTPPTPVAVTNVA